MRRYIISHFNEPIDIASSSLGEKHAVYGGAANLKLGLNNVIEKYRPELIGMATTCLTETIGDDVPMILKEYLAQFGNDNTPEVVTVSTPSYAGTHMEGFHAAMRSTVEQLTRVSEPHNSINLLSGFISAADIRYLKEVCHDFAVKTTILPDYSDTLDGQALNDYPLIPKGGTPIADIKAMGGAKGTIELGSTLPGNSAGSFLQSRYQTKLFQTGLPIGIRATDTFFELLQELSGNEVPRHYKEARGRLVDAMVDGHKYIFGKKAVVYGEEDLVVGITAFLAEIGIKPVICASGGKSGKFAVAVEESLTDLGCEMPEVLENVDFFDIETLAKEIGAELLVGHSKGYTFARKENIPLIRIGFPIHDRVGGQRILHLGYHGAQALFDTVTNAIIEKKQDDSPVGYTYM